MNPRLELGRIRDSLLRRFHQSTPRGRVPGAVIRRLSLELPAFDCDFTAPDCADFRSRHETERFTVREHVESHFLMHIVNAEFMFRCGRSGNGGELASITAHHRGALRRTGIKFGLHSAANDAGLRLLQKLNADPGIAAALMPLDFTHCAIEMRGAQAEIRIRHFGACEVVGQAPKIRRYIRLPSQQLDSLVRVFRALKKITED
jgi:hypothetical protein